MVRDIYIYICIYMYICQIPSLVYWHPLEGAGIGYIWYISIYYPLILDVSSTDIFFVEGSAPFVQTQQILFKALAMRGHGPLA